MPSSISLNLLVKINSLINPQTDRESVINILKKIKEFNERDIETCLYVFDGILKGEYEGIFVYLNEKLVGFLFFVKNSLTLDVFELLWIVVDPDFHRNGLGSMLMNNFLEEIKKRNARLVILHTSEHYSKAKILYTRFGFKCEAIIKDFYAPGDSKEIWILRLN